jgi:hypothetical protein
VPPEENARRLVSEAPRGLPVGTPPSENRHFGFVPPAATVDSPGFGQTATVVSILLSVTFACGVLIAAAHVMNKRFVAPVYDVAANLTAFGCAVAASVLLGHPVPAILSGGAILCWLVLARRTLVDRRQRQEEPR